MTLGGGIGAFAAGAFLGSFANTSVDRLPEGELPLPSPAPCEGCGAPFRLLHRLPLVGYLSARGRCVSCSRPIPWRGPLVETSGGLLALACYVAFGLSWRFFSSAILLLGALTAGLIDARHQVIPNALTLPGLALGLALSLAPGRPSPAEALLGLAVGGGLLALVALAYPEGMGGGDVKFMAMAGTFLGWAKALMAIFVASLAGALIGLALVGLGLRGRKEPMAFGPFLSFGVLVAVFAGSPLLGFSFGWL